MEKYNLIVSREILLGNPTNYLNGTASSFHSSEKHNSKVTTIKDKLSALYSIKPNKRNQSSGSCIPNKPKKSNIPTKEQYREDSPQIESCETEIPTELISDKDENSDSFDKNNMNLVLYGKNSYDSSSSFNNQSPPNMSFLNLDSTDLQKHNATISGRVSKSKMRQQQDRSRA